LCCRAVYTYATWRIKIPQADDVLGYCCGPLWFPEDATYLANRIGIGRGADLVFYTWIMFSLGVLINVHIKMRKNVALLTELARHMAIENPYSIPDGATASPLHEDVSRPDKK